MNNENRLLAVPGAFLLTGSLLLAPAAFATEAPESGAFVTQTGNTVLVEREVFEDAQGGRGVRRDVTVSDAEGEVLGDSRNVRYRTADGDVGRVNRHRWTDAEGNTHKATRSGRMTEEGDVARRRAHTVRDENGEVVQRGVNRGRRDADGGGVAVQRRHRRGDNGAAAGRRVVRTDGQGNRSAHRQRAHRPD